VPQVLGVVARRLGDWTTAEDAVQEAVLAALRTWPADGAPADPRSWLVTVAVRRAVDEMRSATARRRREVRAFLREPVESDPPISGGPPSESGAPDTGVFGTGASDPGASDDSLALLLMCCHPSLSPASAVALTLRAVGGLTTAEIARAFMVPETTMAQRISRAKRTVAASGEPFALPSRAVLPLRLRQVMHVLYLIFTEGHTSSGGDALARADLTDEAIRLTRLLHRAVPADPEVTGLLALMLLTDARRGARQTPAGDLVPMPEQDRARWDAAAIAEGLELIGAAVRAESVGEYQLQALIAAEHDRAGSPEATDWQRIRVLYELLDRMTGNPVVRVNRAVAAGMADGPDAGLAVLDGVVGIPADSHRLLAVRAHLVEMSGDPAAALGLYRRAADRATNLPEQRYLTGRAARLTDRPS